MILQIEKPSPKQELFMRDKHKFIAFGGARGGGKSWALRVKAVLMAERYAGIRIKMVDAAERQPDYILADVAELHRILKEQA